MSPPVGDTATAVPVRRWRRLVVPPRLRVDVLLAGLVALATFVVHDVGYLLSRPFWTDESWVAISTRLPLSDLLRVSASTPVGFTLLLHLVPARGGELLRIVPLLFSAATVAMAYVFTRSLPWRGGRLGRTAAVVAAAATLLSRSSLLRDDLKQYTADAAVALVVWWLLARVEQAWTRRRLVALAAVVAGGFLISAPAAFVGAAAFAILVVQSALRRDLRRTVEAVVAGGGCGLLLVAFYLALYRPGVPPDLRDYWASYYVPLSRGPAAVGDFLGSRSSELAGYLGMGRWWCVLVLVLAGVATIVRLGRPATACLVPVLVGEMVALAAVQQYPLFDLRTSHFLTVILAVTAAIGVLGAASLVPRATRAVPAAVAVVAVALMVLNPAVRSLVRAPTIPDEDVRTPTRYVDAHLTPGDLVLVNMTSNWAFGYYWPRGTPAIQSVTGNLQRFVTVFPDQPDIFVATGRDRAAVDQVVDRVAAAAAARGTGARVWFIHQHYQEQERQYFDAAFAAHRLGSSTVLDDQLELLTPDLP